jgi:hypothetical protein
LRKLLSQALDKTGISMALGIWGVGANEPPARVPKPG